MTTDALPRSWVQFIEDGHEYVDEHGRRLPHVTGVLEATGLVDFSHIPDHVRRWALDRGRRVHRAARYLIEGTLDEDTVDEGDRGYVDSLSLLLTDPQADLEIIPDAAEQPMVHSVYRYAGTPDAPGFWRSRVAVADWCCGDLTFAGKRYQTAAYAEMLRREPPAAWLDFTASTPIARIGVRLRKDGKFPKLEPYDDWADWNVFLAALTVFNAQVKLGRRIL